MIHVRPRSVTMALLIATVVAMAMSCGKRSSLTINSMAPRPILPVYERTVSGVSLALPAEYPPANWERKDGICTSSFTVWPITADYHLDTNLRKFIRLREQADGYYYHRYPSDGYWVEKVMLKVGLKDALSVSGIRLVVSAHRGWVYRGRRFGEFFGNREERVRVLRLVGGRFLEVVDLPKEPPGDARSGCGSIATLWFERRERVDAMARLYDSIYWWDRTARARDLRYQELLDEQMRESRERNWAPAQKPRPPGKTIPFIRH